MKIQPTGAVPPVIQQTPVDHQYQAEAKARAIAVLQGKDPSTAKAPEVTKPQHQAPNSITFKTTKNPRPQAQPQPEPEIEAQAEEVGAIAAEIPAQAPENNANITDTEPKVEDTQLSARLAALAKREKSLRLKAQQQDQAYKQREQELKAREEKLSQAPQFDQTQYVSKQQLKAETLRALEDAGVSYDEVTQQYINQGQKNPYYENVISKLQSRIDQLETKTQETQKQAEERQKAEYQAALTTIRQDVATLVKTDPNYEMINSTRSVNDVVELIERTFKEEGRVMSNEEAANEVENYLLDEATKLSNINKVRSRITSQQTPASAPAKTSTPAANPNPKQTQPMKTLTNTNSTQRQMSARQRAIAAFKGEL